MHSQRQILKRTKKELWKAQQASRTLESNSHEGKIVTGLPTLFNRKTGGCICVSPISAATQILSNYRIMSVFKKKIFM